MPKPENIQYSMMPDTDLKDDLLRRPNSKEAQHFITSA